MYVSGLILFITHLRLCWAEQNLEKLHLSVKLKTALNLSQYFSHILMTRQQCQQLLQRRGSVSVWVERTHIHHATFRPLYQRRWGVNNGAETQCARETKFTGISHLHNLKTICRGKTLDSRTLSPHKCDDSQIIHKFLCVCHLFRAWNSAL